MASPTKIQRDEARKLEGEHGHAQPVDGKANLENPTSLDDRQIPSTSQLSSKTPDCRDNDRAYRPFGETPSRQSSGIKTSGFVLSPPSRISNYKEKDDYSLDPPSRLAPTQEMINAWKGTHEREIWQGVGRKRKEGEVC